MATTTEIRNKILVRLGVAGVGETITDTGITTDIDAAYAEAYAMLRNKGLVTWAAADDVPAEFVNDIVDIVALSRISEYGVSDSRLARILASAGNEGRSAMNRLRSMISEPYEDNSATGVYY